MKDTDDYRPGPDSQPHPGVPQGKTFSFEFAESKIFPGTSRTITVYVPAQYKGDVPACVYVGLDGLGFLAPVVFDNLIQKKEMPVTIAIGISPGTSTNINGTEDQRFNRSFEFDSLNGSLARFITEEIFPAVETHRTSDGLKIWLSRDPNDHCAGGASTGGIAAFTLAWERPDLFRRVFSAIGTFVDMRGGDRYPVLVRETEPKPIRIFQQDGSYDEWTGGPEFGDWWMSNQALDRSLDFAGYDHQHIWGTGPHSSKHADAIFPEAMRFLWQGWPKPVVAQTGRTQNVILKSVLDPDSSWEQVETSTMDCGELAANPRGEVYFQAGPKRQTYVISDAGNVSEASGFPTGKVFAFAADGAVVTTTNIDATCVTVTGSGNAYATQAAAGKVWLIKPNSKKIMLDEGLKHPTGIALTPDDMWLAVMEGGSHYGYSYRIRADGAVDIKQSFYRAHVPDWAEDSGSGGACMDHEGHLYVATRMGIQIFDRNGRSRGILPMPAGEATSVCFGGADFKTLFVSSGGKLYRRHMRLAGAPAFEPAIKLPPWHAG